MKYIVWPMSIIGAFSAGFLMGKDRMDAVAMAVAIGFIASLIIFYATMIKKSSRRRVDAYVIKEKVEPIGPNRQVR